MNELTKLALENEENYERYLKRMTESIRCSTKGLIPYFASESQRILDVGCGSGVIMDAVRSVNHAAEIIGIDINEEDVRKFNSERDDLDIRCCDIYDMDETFDCLIFSSVLHEVSSYEPDETQRFHAQPILKMLKKANVLLVKGGKIIIRDGLEHEGNKTVLIRMSDIQKNLWIGRFQKESPAYAKEQIIQEGEYYRVSEKLMQEFICTYTWGESSWAREVREKFGILDHETWKQTVRDAGFKITACMSAAEEYEKYMGEKIVIREGSFPEAFTITMIAEKI